MIVVNNLKLFLFFLFLVLANSQNEITSNEITTNDLSGKTVDGDIDLTGDKKYLGATVQVKFYYECLCPYCRKFGTDQLQEVVQKLSPYIQLFTYPYGNAETSDNNGKIEFTCQHGPKECYGNKLHACALDILHGDTAVLYNICMMGSEQQDKGSDDAAAEECGRSMAIDAEPIETCAKGDRGTDLLNYYGIETKKVNHTYVPFVLINEKIYDGDNLFDHLCVLLKNVPPECQRH